MGIKRRPKHVLIVVAALLVASGGVRLMVGMGPAVAFAQDQMAQTDTVVARDPEPLAVEPLVAALQARETRVAQRETAINDRLRALTLAEDELAKRLTELRQAEASLTAALALSETANDVDIARLTTVYENMKPADAADLFEQMAPDFASGFLVRMRPDAAAAVLAGLDPQTAYSISAIIAGRNANAPTQ